MKLSQLTSKPKLEKIVIDDEKIVASYGEPIEFWVYDRQGMDTFMKLATLEGEQDVSTISEVVKNLILDEKGNKILDGDKLLPVDVMIKCIEVTVRRLGNSITQTLGKSLQS
jgi:hypothetical protein